MHLFEKKLDTETIYQGRILNLRKDRVRLPDGKESFREVVEHPGAVAVVALDAEKNVYLVRQYRYPVAKALLEIPAGKLDPGEEPYSCARRELAEEVNLKADKWRLLATFYTTPGFSDEIMYLFMATDLKPHYQEPDTEEFLQVEKLSLKNAIKQALDGTIQDAKSISGLLIVARLLQT